MEYGVTVFFAPPGTERMKCTLVDENDGGYYFMDQQNRLYRYNKTNKEVEIFAYSKYVRYNRNDDIAGVVVITPPDNIVALEVAHADS